jgi:hypothetical protein
VASVADTLQKEGSDAVFVVTLSAASGKTITVDWATVDGSALAGSDYTAASGTLTFGPGATEQTITVSLLDDLEADPDEGFSVLLSNLVNAGAGDVSASLDDLALALER